VSARYFGDPDSGLVVCLHQPDCAEWAADADGGAAGRLGADAGRQHGLEYRREPGLAAGARRAGGRPGARGLDGAPRRLEADICLALDLCDGCLVDRCGADWRDVMLDYGHAWLALAGYSLAAGAGVWLAGVCYRAGGLTRH